ncbi:MAG: ABC transporter substrate-binding protein [Lachnospiraceae bacterium]|nr:ABC transporter substrate-binding protein [Lachnospiraceae bacterium]
MQAGSIDMVTNADDNLFIDGTISDKTNNKLKDNNDEQRNSVENDPINIEKEGNSDLSFNSLENYKERNIPSIYTQDNENEWYCNVLLNKDGEIEYYTLSEDADGNSMWRYTLKEGETAKMQEVSGDSKENTQTVWNAKNGLSWFREPVHWIEEIKSKISYGRVVFFRGEDHNDYAWYMGEGEKPHLVRREGDSCTEILIPDWRITEQAVVAVLENGNIVSADVGRECFVYNQEDGSLLNRFECGWYESICVKGNIIYITTRGGASVQRYDAQEQEFLPTIEAGFDNSVRIALQEDSVYVCTPSGIFCAKETGTMFQKILEAGTFHFAKDTGNMLKFFVIGEAFYIVYGEDKGCIKKYSPMLEGEVASDSLTIYSLTSNDIILDIISEFQNEYPDIELLYETGEGGDGSVSIADRIRALNTRILAGDGPDMLLLDGLPADSYIGKGILEDMTPMLESVKGELMPNILSAYTVEDKIYMLPLRIRIPVFLTTGQEPGLYSTLEALVNYSERDGRITPEYQSYMDLLEILYYNYMPEIVSEAGEVNRASIAEFLGLVKRFCVSEQAVEEQMDRAIYMEGRAVGVLLNHHDADFAFTVINGGYTLGVNPAAVESRGGEIVGNNGLFFPNGLIGVNKLSNKKELARFFVEFIFSYDAQERDVASAGYPIYTPILDKFAQVDASNSSRSFGTPDGLRVSLRFFTQEESAKMIQIVKEVHTPFTMDDSIWEIFRTAGEDYLKGNKDLGKSVEEIAERIQLYLYE